MICQFWKEEKGYSGDVEFVTDGNIQTHLAEKDLEVNFKTGHSINPLERGHIAYRTDDLEKFKNHLKVKALSILTGVKQLLQAGNRFFYDPDGNIIEVHEKEVS